MTTRAEKRTVYQRIQAAIKSDRLIKGDCEECGAFPVHAHHPNGYEPPNDLDVVWLCPPHHLARHRRHAVIRPAVPGAFLPVPYEPVRTLDDDMLRRLGFDLSPRQRQIADLVIAGLNVPQIAARLKRSPSTVKAHKQALYMKLGVNSASELARALSE